MSWFSDAAAGIVGDWIGYEVSGHYNRDAMDYQHRLNKEMYQNRYQWTVEDLRKAGLNPILATGGLASSGASVGLPSVSSGNVSNAMAAHRKMSEIDKANIEIGKENAAANSKNADTNAKTGASTVALNKSTEAVNNAREATEKATAQRTIAAIVNDAKETAAKVDMFAKQGEAAIRNAAAHEQDVATGLYSARSNYSYQRYLEKESEQRRKSAEYDYERKKNKNKWSDSDSGIGDYTWGGLTGALGEIISDISPFQIFK